MISVRDILVGRARSSDLHGETLIDSGILADALNEPRGIIPGTLRKKSLLNLKAVVLRKTGDDARVSSGTSLSLHLKSLETQHRSSENSLCLLNVKNPNHMVKSELMSLNFLGENSVVGIGRFL